MQILRASGVNRKYAPRASVRFTANTAENRFGQIPAVMELRSRRSCEKPMNKILGIILIVVGIIGLAWGGFTYTTREKIADIGPIHASRDKTHSVPLPPVAGALALMGGVALLVVGKNN